MRALRLGLLVALSIALAAGCRSGSNAPAHVSGKVTYKGEAVPAGVVTFHAPDQDYTAMLKPDGTYEIDAAPGDIVVTVDTEMFNLHRNVPAYGKGAGQAMDQQRLEAEKKMGRPVGQDAPKYVKIPDKYTKREASPLKTTLKAGKQPYDIPLTD